MTSKELKGAVALIRVYQYCMHLLVHFLASGAGAFPS